MRETNKDCPICEEIWYNRNEDTFVYTIETGEWDDWNDDFYKEEIHVNYCFNCGKSYRIEDLINEMDGFLKGEHSLEQIELLLNKAHAKQIEGFNDAFEERTWRFKYSVEEKDELVRERMVQLKAKIDEYLTHFADEGGER